MDFDALKKYAKKVKQEIDYDLDETIVANVSGVTFEGRQELLAVLNGTEGVALERDRRNEYDSYAVKVMVCIEGVFKCVGFIPRQMSKRISNSLDNGISLSAGIKRILGGGEGMSFGLDIYIYPER